jgi:hypothetical protein
MTLDTTLAQLSWRGTEKGFFEVNASTRRKPPLLLDEALEAWASGTCKFFGVCPRKARGNKTEDVIDRHATLWCDIDSEHGPAIIEQRLDPLGLHPSAVVSSGRGYHVYFALTEPMPIDRVERFNKRLIEVTGGDPACWNRNRLLRIPGSVNEKHGVTVTLTDLSGQVFPLEALDRLGPLPELPSPRPRRARIFSRDEPWEEAGVGMDWNEPDELNLTALLAIDRAYLQDRPKRGWTRDGRSRSEVEQGIVYRLVGQGASDATIIEFADERLARHIEERGAGGEASDWYIRAAIHAARRQYWERGYITSKRGGWPKNRDAKYRHRSVDDLHLLLDLVDGQTTSEWVQQARALGCSRSSAYEYRRRFVQMGLVTVRGGRLHRGGVAHSGSRLATSSPVQT